MRLYQVTITSLNIFISNKSPASGGAFMPLWYALPTKELL